MSKMAEAVDVGDGPLLVELRAGNSSAFAALMRRNNQRLFRLARGVLRDDAEAEDAVQDGYIQAFTHLDGFKGQASIATWLARIVLNEALARLRRRRPTVNLEETGDPMPGTEALPQLGAGEPSPEQVLARREIRRTIERAVDSLPQSFRIVFILRAIEQMSIEETAHYLGIPAETVKTRFHRANRLLRHSLAQHLDAILDGAFPFLGARCDRVVAAVLERLDLSTPAKIGSRTDA